MMIVILIITLMYLAFIGSFIYGFNKIKVFFLCNFSFGEQKRYADMFVIFFSTFFEIFSEVLLID